MKRRERHGRPLRGPLAVPNAYGRLARPVSPPGPEAYFAWCVSTSLARITRQCREVLHGVDVGIEEVPHLHTDWSGHQVPLAAAVEATEESPARVVIYRRPLEHRAATRKGLRILTYRTLVEQLAALTGRSVDEIDPEGLSDSDDW